MKVNSNILNHHWTVKLLLMAVFTIFHTLVLSGNSHAIILLPATAPIELFSNPSEIHSIKTFDFKEDLSLSDVIHKISSFFTCDRHFILVQNSQIQICFNRLNKQVLTYNKPIFFHQMSIPSLDADDDPSILFHF